MNNTMGGTCCHIVAQVAISTIPPTQFANDATIRSSLNISILRFECPVTGAKRYALLRTPNSLLRAAKMSPSVACVVMSVAAISGPHS